VAFLRNHFCAASLMANRPDPNFLIISDLRNALIVKQLRNTLILNLLRKPLKISYLRAACGCSSKKSPQGA